MNEAELEAMLLAAHAERDGARLAEGYALAADFAERAGEVDRACFFLTQAWIFALDVGAPNAGALRARLVAHGREKDA